LRTSICAIALAASAGRRISSAMHPVPDFVKLGAVSKLYDTGKLA
jgi:hypothetical protein